MKSTMMFTVIAITAIVLMSSFDLTLMPTNPIKIPESMLPNALFICPAQNSVWDNIADAMSHAKQLITIILIFAITILIVTWAWALYQNLLKDKFSRDVYKQPWATTKLLFWFLVALILIMKTPNYFRSVHVTGLRGEWVLCEDNTPGAKAVYADSVKP